MSSLYYIIYHIHLQLACLSLSSIFTSNTRIICSLHMWQHLIYVSLMHFYTHALRVSRLRIIDWIWKVCLNSSMSLLYERESVNPAPRILSGICNRITNTHGRHHITYRNIYYGDFIHALTRSFKSIIRILYVMMVQYAGNHIFKWCPLLFAIIIITYVYIVENNVPEDYTGTTTRSKKSFTI